jgi:hypothetical protein
MNNRRLPAVQTTTGALGDTSYRQRDRVTVRGEDAPRDVSIRDMLRYRRYIERVPNTDVAHHCRYGHLDCATHDGGYCANEAYANYLSIRDELELTEEQVDLLEEEIDAGTA